MCSTTVKIRYILILNSEKREGTKWWSRRTLNLPPLMSTAKLQLNDHWFYTHTHTHTHTRTHTHTHRYLAKKCVCKGTNHNKRVGETQLYNKFPYQTVGWPTDWRTIILQKFAHGVWKLWSPCQAPQPMSLASVGESPRVFGFEDQQGLTSGVP